MPTKTKIDVNLGWLAKRALATAPDSPPMRKWAQRSAVSVRTFWFFRYWRYSQGGGDWPDTKRRQTGKSKFILRDTETLLRAVKPKFTNEPGQFEKFDGKVITIGYGGPGLHPKFNGPVSALARIHNNGLGRMPQRKIIVDPDRRVIKDIKKDLRKTALKIFFRR